MIRSPFPDVEIPAKPLTEFVLARAAEFGDVPASIAQRTWYMGSNSAWTEMCRAGSNLANQTPSVVSRNSA